MIAKQERRWGRAIILLFITLLIVGGTGSYLYYTRHKEPTQGIFVYNLEMIKEDVVSGHLYQSS